MNRLTTWSNLGTDVKDCGNINDVLIKSNLNYEVHTEKIKTSNGLIIPGRVATVANINGVDTVLGDVSDKYTICQNIDAFDFVDNISDELTFEKAGQTASGMVYIIAALPSVTVLDDEIKPYVILQNGHNGRYSFKTTIAPLRIVCQNQFNIAFKNSSNVISILHSSNMLNKMNSAEILLNSVANYMSEFNNNAIELATTKLSKSPEDIISEFFNFAKDDNVSKRVINKIEKDESAFINAYNAEDNQNFKGTVWGMTNAFSDFITHREVKNTKNASENKFMSVTFNPIAMANFINFVKSKSISI